LPVEVNTSPHVPTRFVDVVPALAFAPYELGEAIVGHAVLADWAAGVGSTTVYMSSCTALIYTGGRRGYS
jgi:hypothetical protein